MIARKEIEEDLKRHLAPKRLSHSYGVMETAALLAERWGADAEQCRLAGLLHDAGKWQTQEAIMPACEARGIPLTEEDRACPQVLHAYLSEAIAREDYGVTDDEVLKAVRHHCLGAPDMGLVEKIVFLADMIEPGRTGEWVEPIRKLAYEDLNQAVMACYELTIAHNEAKGAHIHNSVWAHKKSLEEQIHGG